MQIHYSSQIPLSESAQRLVDFDVDSIRQVIAAEHGPEPDVWLAATEGYQVNGHCLRDSESIRLIAYARDAGVIYATDGCNACRHIVELRLETSANDDLASVSLHTQLPPSLLARLADILRGRP